MLLILKNEILVIVEERLQIKNNNNDNIYIPV